MIAGVDQTNCIAAGISTIVKNLEAYSEHIAARSHNGGKGILITTGGNGKSCFSIGFFLRIGATGRGHVILCCNRAQFLYAHVL